VTDWDDHALTFVIILGWVVLIIIMLGVMS